MQKISSAEFNRKKEIAIATSPVRKIVNTADVKIKDNEVFVDNQKILFSNNGIMQFAETMGMPSKFVTKYAGIFGEAGRNAFINHIATGLGSKNSKRFKTNNIMLIGSPVTGAVIDVKPSDHRYISGVSFMKVVEDTLNDNKDLAVKSFEIDKERGHVRIDTLNPKKSFNFGKDEDFFTGLNFSQNPEQGTHLSQFMFRQICENGMMRRDDVKVEIGYDDDIMRGLYTNIAKIAKNDFLPADFGKRVKRAGNTKASLSELNVALRFIPKSRDLDRLINYSEIMHDLRGRRINPEKLNSQQQKNCILDASVWDVVNAMTDFASHDYGFKVGATESREIQTEASKIFFKRNYDTENLVVR